MGHFRYVSLFEGFWGYRNVWDMIAGEESFMIATAGARSSTFAFGKMLSGNTGLTSEWKWVEFFGHGTVSFYIHHAG